MTDAPPPDRRVLATVLTAACLAAAAITSALTWRGAANSWLFLVLMSVAICARLMITWEGDVRGLSGVFLCSMLAIGFLDPFCAVMVAVVPEIVVTPIERRFGIHDWQLGLLPMNLAGVALADALVGWAVLKIDVSHSGAAFPFVLAAAGAAVIVINVVVVDVLFCTFYGRPIRITGLAREYLPVAGLNIALAAALAELYAQTGIAVIVFALLIVLAFSYMTRLVALARQRTREYADLSWGVLSSLIRTLDQRDRRAARHCAATARFARDIAAGAGMSERDQELAHTSGLLHDIGRFALSDRVLEPTGELTQEDWRVVRRHPEIGADLLQDLGVYGPVAEIVHTHHERIDGRGYPRGLSAGEIPPIARIVAVAEVYDTLTAPDTYRSQMTSFEALTELRRVAGTQLDPEYVEILAGLLAGQGTEYRHADDADYDRELDIERRINDAASG